MVTYLHDKIQYTIDRSVSEYTKATVHYAIMCYGFLLNTEEHYGESISFNDFGDLILDHYEGNDRIFEIVAVLRNLEK